MAWYPLVMSTTSSLTPETVVLNTGVYQVVGQFYGEPEMTGIPCFPIKTNVSPIWTQLDPQTLVRFDSFDGEFYTVQPVCSSEQEQKTHRRVIYWLSRLPFDYKPYGGAALVHKNFLKYFLKYKAGR